jgi:hypothetical protein
MANPFMAEVNARLGRMWEYMQQENMAAEERAAKADPLKHRLSRVMERGKPLNYRYRPVKVGRREVRYCWATNRNVAGFYLGWREVETPKLIRRDQWVARRVKQRVIDMMRNRADAHRARLNKGK